MKISSSRSTWTTVRIFALNQSLLGTPTFRRSECGCDHLRSEDFHPWILPRLGDLAVAISSRIEDWLVTPEYISWNIILYKSALTAGLQLLEHCSILFPPAKPHPLVSSSPHSLWELYTIAPNFQSNSGGCLRWNHKQVQSLYRPTARFYKFT